MRITAMATLPSTWPTGMRRSARVYAAAASPASSFGWRRTMASSAGARHVSVPMPPRSRRHLRRCGRSWSGVTPGTARRLPATCTARDFGTIGSRPATSPTPASTWHCGTCAERRADSRCYRLFGGPVQNEIDYFYYLAQGTPDELRAQCAEGVARGYRCYYLKVGIDAVAEEAMLEAVRAPSGQWRGSGSTPTRPGRCRKR